MGAKPFKMVDPQNPLEPGQEFGGEFLRVKNLNVPEAIAIVAQQQRITQIVIGESQRSFWQRLLKGSFTEKLMKLIGKKRIDLHIIATEN